MTGNQIRGLKYEFLTILINSIWCPGTSKFNKLMFAHNLTNT